MYKIHKCNGVYQNVFVLVHPKENPPPYDNSNDNIRTLTYFSR